MKYIRLLIGKLKWFKGFPYETVYSHPEYTGRKSLQMTSNSQTDNPLMFLRKYAVRVFSLHLSMRLFGLQSSGSYTSLNRDRHGIHCHTHTHTHTHTATQMHTLHPPSLSFFLSFFLSFPFLALFLFLPVYLSHKMCTVPWFWHCATLNQTFHMVGWPFQ